MLRYALLVLLATPEMTLERLGWISGCWSLQTGPVTIEESWSRPAGGTLLGWSRVVKAGRTVSREFLQIEAKDGKLVYTPRVGPNATATPFPLIKLTEDEVIFENPAHDFPQRIIYRKQAGGLFARIEGKDKGKERAQDFPYRKAECP
jgi:hypothetical protein